MKRLENEHIILRDLTIEDAPDMYAYAKDDRVGPRAGWEPHKDLGETERILKMMQAGGEVWALYHKADQKLIGTVGLHKESYPITQGDVYAIGFVLHPDYWGKGIMKMACDLVFGHAFADKGLKEVYANHFDFNPRSGGFMKKYGMTFVGEWHNEETKVDNLLYKITAEGYAGVMGEGK